MAWREYGQPNASGGVDIYRTDDQGNFEFVRSETMEQNQAGGGGGGGTTGGGGGNVGYIPGSDYMNYMGGQAIALANAKYQEALLELQKTRYAEVEKPNAETTRRALEAQMALGQAQQGLAEAQRQDQVNQFAQTQGAQQQQFDVNTAMNTWQGQAQQAAQRGAATGGYAATSAQPDLPYHYQRDQVSRDFRAQFGRDPTPQEMEQQLPWYSNATQQSPTTQLPTTPAPDDKAKADSVRRQIEAKVGRAITEPEWNTLVSGKFDPQHPMVTGGQAKAGSLLTDLTNKPGDQHPMKIPGIELMEQMPESYKKLREGQPAYNFNDPQQGMINSRTGQIQVPDGKGGSKDLEPAKGYTPPATQPAAPGGGQVAIPGELPAQPGGGQGQVGGGPIRIQGGLPGQGQQAEQSRARMEEKQAAIARGASQQELRQIDAKYGSLQTSGGVSAQGMPSSLPGQGSTDFSKFANKYDNTSGGNQPGAVSAQGQRFDATLGPASLNSPVAQQGAQGMPTSLPGQGSTDFSKFANKYATDVNSNIGKSQQPYTPVGQPASTTGGTIGQVQAQGQTSSQQQGGQESLQLVYNPITGQMEYKGINLMQQQLSEQLGLGQLSIAQAAQKLDEEVQRGNLTIAQKDQALRDLQNQQQYGLQGRAQTLSETLGLGGLSLDQARQALDEKVQTGQLTIAQRDQALREKESEQQYGLQGRAQTLSEQLGLGGLSLDQAAQKLDEEVQRGNLTIAQKDQLLREKQSGQQFGLQEAGVTGRYGGQATLEREQFQAQQALEKARQTLDEKVQLGQLSVVERDQALKELEAQQNYNIAQRAQALSEQTQLGKLGLEKEQFGWGQQTDVAGLLGEYGGKSTLQGRQMTMQEQQAAQDWQYKQAMMAANPANYAVTAAMQGRAPWQQGLTAGAPASGGPASMQAAGQGAQAQAAQQQPAWKQGLLSGQSGGAATADLKAQWGVPQAQKMSGLQYGRMGTDQKAAFGSAVQATGQSQQDYEDEMKKWQPKAQGTAATQWR